MENVIVVPVQNPDVMQLQDSINKAVQEAKEIEIVISAMDVETASHFVKNLTKIDKTAEELRKSNVQPLNDRVKEINSFFKGLVGPVQAEVVRLKDLLLTYTKKQAEISRQKAETERKAAEEKAIQEAIEKEAKLKKAAELRKFKIEKFRELSFKYRSQGVPDEKILDDILWACKTTEDILLTQDEIKYILGDREELEVKVQRVEVAVIPETIIEKKKLSTVNTSGVGTRRVAKWEVTDPKLIPAEYWILDETKINAIRRAAGVDCEKSSIPGVRFYFEETIGLTR
jgi:hypothetical protein